MNEQKLKQLQIANILHDIGLDDDLIEIMTSLTHEEIQNSINNKSSY